MRKCEPTSALQIAHQTRLLERANNVREWARQWCRTEPLLEQNVWYLRVTAFFKRRVFIYGGIGRFTIFWRIFSILLTQTTALKIMAFFFIKQQQNKLLPASIFAQIWSLVRKNQCLFPISKIQDFYPAPSLIYSKSRRHTFVSLNTKPRWQIFCQVYERSNAIFWFFYHI